MSEIYRILHTADWHLRDSQFGSSARGEDFTRAAHTVVDTAMAYGPVHAICNCGDILNVTRPSSKNVRDLLEIDRRLVAAGIPMYVISGNHDRAQPSWLSTLYGELGMGGGKKAGIIDADNRLLEIPGTPLNVYGAPSMGAAAFRESRDGWPPADILMAHELVKEFVAFKPDDDALRVGDMPSKYRMVLLGDIHARAYVANGDGFAGYPGSIELCSRNEPAAKSVTVFEVPDGYSSLAAKEVEVAIPTRAAAFFKVMTQACLDKALEKLRPRVVDDPIVLVSYDRRMAGVPAAFMAALAGSRSILRCKSFSDVDARRMLVGRGGDNEMRGPRDFMGDFIAAGTPLHTLACSLTDPQADAAEMMRGYVDEKLKKYEDESDAFENPGLRPA